MKSFNPTVPTMATLTAATIGLAIGLSIIGPTQDPRSTPTDTVANHACDVGSCTPQMVDQLPDCYTTGNRICGDPEQVHASDAWKAWDTAGGWSYLHASPDVENRVDYIGTATLPPYVDESAGYGAIPSRDGWYVFRAVPVDLADTGTTYASATNGKG